MPNFFENTARRRDVTTNAFAKPRRTASRRCSEALYLFPAPPLFNVNYQSAPRTVRIQQFTLRQSPVSCILCPVSRVLRPASGFTPCASRSYLLCPLIIAQRPLCIAPSCRLCICCTFSVITISDILPQSNSESRSHASCPALRILCPASCVPCPVDCILRPASCFAPDYALCSLCSYQHFPLSLVPRHALCLLCASSCILLYHATLRFYNFGLSCRMAIPSAAPRLFRRYNLEYNRTKVPSAVKPENTNRCSILCKRLKMALLHFCCRFRYCFFEQSIRKILTFALFGYKIKS